MTIWKYELSTTDEQRLMMPRGSTILSLQVQRDIPCIWVLVNERAECRQRRIRIYGTGHPVDGTVLPMGPHASGVFVGTYQLAGGALVFHAFDLGEL